MILAPLSAARALQAEPQRTEVRQARAQAGRPAALRARAPRPMPEHPVRLAVQRVKRAPGTLGKGARVNRAPPAMTAKVASPRRALAATETRPAAVACAVS